MIRLPDQQGAGSTSIVSAEEPTDTLIFVHLPGMTSKSAQPAESMSSRGFAPRDLLITVVSPDVAPALDLNRAIAAEDGEALAESAADQAGRRAQLLGLYIGQVKARIERAWMRPRTAIGDDLFVLREPADARLLQGVIA